MGNFSNETSIHGVKYILSPDTQKVLRIFWSVALFVSFCGFSYYFYTAYTKWQFVSKKQKLDLC